MAVLLWNVAAVAFIFILMKYVLPVITGLVLPRSISGALLLEQQLKVNGIATEGLPQQFYDDCIKWAEGVARFAGKDPPKPGKPAEVADFVEILQNLAQVAALWVREPESPMFKSYGESKNGYRALFENYDIKRAATPARHPA
jgi:hypothetical protein